MRLGIRLFIGLLFLALLGFAATKLFDKSTPIPVHSPQSHTVNKTEPAPIVQSFIHTCPALNEGRSGRMLVIADAGEWLICPVCKEKISDHTVSDHLYEAIFLSPQKQLELDVRKVYVEKRLLSGSASLEASVVLDAEFYKAQAELIEALAQAQGGGEWTKNRVESARLQLKLIGLEDGLIEEISKQKAADKSLIEIQRGGDAWVYADADEDLAVSLRSGESLSIRMPGSNKSYPAFLRSVDEKSDPAQRKSRLRVWAPQGGDFLKAEQVVTLSVPARFGELLALDESAVLNSNGRKLVFIDRGQGLFERRAVVLGRSVGGFVEIRSGLLEGDRLLASPAKLGIAISVARD